MSLNQIPSYSLVGGRRGLDHRRRGDGAESVLCGERVGVDDAGPVVVRVAARAVSWHVVDHGERTPCRARSVRRREFGGHHGSRGRPHADQPGGGGDGLVGAVVLEQSGRFEQRRARRRSAIRLARRRVARLRPPPVGGGERVRPGGHRLHLHGLGTPAAAGVGPTGGHLTRHDTAEVVLRAQTVDHADAVGDDDVDGAAILDHRAVGLADAEHLVGGGARVVTVGRREGNPGARADVGIGRATGQRRAGVHVECRPCNVPDGSHGGEALSVPLHATGVRHHADGTLVVHRHEPNRHRSVGVRAAGDRPAVVVVEDLVARPALIDRPAVRAPLAHAATVAEARPFDHHGDDITGGGFDTRCASGQHQQGRGNEDGQHQPNTTHVTQP